MDNRVFVNLPCTRLIKMTLCHQLIQNHQQQCHYYLIRIPTHMDQQRHHIVLQSLQPFSISTFYPQEFDIKEWIQEHGRRLQILERSLHKDHNAFPRYIQRYHPGKGLTRSINQLIHVDILHIGGNPKRWTSFASVHGHQGLEHMYDLSGKWDKPPTSMNIHMKQSMRLTTLGNYALIALHAECHIRRKMAMNRWKESYRVLRKHSIQRLILSHLQGELD